VSCEICNTFDYTTEIEQFKMDGWIQIYDKWFCSKRCMYISCYPEGNGDATEKCVAEDSDATKTLKTREEAE
jgi:hypothetical protein